ncbi:putative vitamin H transporter [Thozetella sp. PMI_491]|nr:putative vitamin H transporter [Thozetella sp. PMI_491]
MPMVFGIYLLQLMDKNSLSFAAIMGIKDDAHLTPSQYSWLGSIVYFGYLGGEIPAAFFMQRIPLAKYVGCMSMLWGIVVAMHAVCHDFSSLAAVRFLLGAIEVCTAPAAIYLTSTWYTKEEQVTRVAIWYSTSGWAQVLNGFFAWCIYHAPHFRWQALFVFYGALTFVTGVVLFFALAASPTEASWLTDDEKIIALERVRGNKTGTEVWKFNKAQIRECLLDIRFWLVLLLLILLGLPNGGVTAFGPTIIAGFGYDVPTTTLLSMAPGAAQVVGTFLALHVAKRTNRTFQGIYTLVIACVGIVMMLAIPAKYTSARYGGYILLMQFPIAVVSIIAFMTGGVAGSTKKFAFGAIYQIGYSVGNIIGPQTYVGYDAPNYYIAKYTMLGSLIVAIFAIGAFGLIHKLWNNKRDREASISDDDIHVHNEEFADKTDFELKSFRYPI